jgi:hypothetical protein
MTTAAREVVIPGHRHRITCETLDDARRVAYLAVAHARPCELIVHDAYHRVLHHELIDGHQTPPTGSPPTAEQPKPITDVRVGNDASRAREDTPAPLAGSRRRAGPRSRRRPSAARKQPTHQGRQ